MKTVAVCNADHRPFDKPFFKQYTYSNGNSKEAYIEIDEGSDPPYCFICGEKMKVPSG